MGKNSAGFPRDKLQIVSVLITKSDREDGNIPSLRLGDDTLPGGAHPRPAVVAVRQGYDHRHPVLILSLKKGVESEIQRIKERSSVPAVKDINLFNLIS